MLTLFCVPATNLENGQTFTIKHNSLWVNVFTMSRANMVEVIDDYIKRDWIHSQEYAIVEVEFSTENLASYMTSLHNGDSDTPVCIVKSISSYTPPAK